MQFIDENARSSTKKTELDLRLKSMQQELAIFQDANAANMKLKSEVAQLTGKPNTICMRDIIFRTVKKNKSQLKKNISEIVYLLGYF